MKMQEADGCAAPMSAEEQHNLYTSMADEAFDEEEGHANGITLTPSGRV